MTDLVELWTIAEELDWIAHHATPGGPIHTLTGTAAEHLRQAANTIHTHTCPTCGAGSNRRWREEEAAAYNAIRASLDEGLISPRDVIPLMRDVHTRYAWRRAG